VTADPRIFCVATRRMGSLGYNVHSLRLCRFGESILVLTYKGVAETIGDSYGKIFSAAWAVKPRFNAGANSLNGVSCSNEQRYVRKPRSLFDHLCSTTRFYRSFQLSVLKLFAIGRNNLKVDSF